MPSDARIGLGRQPSHARTDWLDRSSIQEDRNVGLLGQRAEEPGVSACGWPSRGDVRAVGTLPPARVRSTAPTANEPDGLSEEADTALVRGEASRLEPSRGMR